MKLTDDVKINEEYKYSIEEILSLTKEHIDIKIRQSIQMTPIEQIMFLHLLINNIVLNGFKLMPQFKVGNYRVDFMCEYKNKRLAIECDGHDFHEKTKEQAIKDKKRDRYFNSIRLPVIHFTGREIYSGNEWRNDIATAFKVNLF